MANISAKLAATVKQFANERGNLTPEAFRAALSGINPSLKDKLDMAGFAIAADALDLPGGAVPQAFSNFDADHDGMVEIAAIVRQAAEYDLNGDGELNAGELASFVAGEPLPALPIVSTQSKPQPAPPPSTPDQVLQQSFAAVAPGGELSAGGLANALTPLAKKGSPGQLDIEGFRAFGAALGVSAEQSDRVFAGLAQGRETIDINEVVTAAAGFNGGDASWNLDDMRTVAAAMNAFVPASVPASGPAGPANTGPLPPLNVVTIPGSTAPATSASVPQTAATAANASSGAGFGPVTTASGTSVGSIAQPKSTGGVAPSSGVVSGILAQEGLTTGERQLLEIVQDGDVSGYLNDIHTYLEDMYVKENGGNLPRTPDALQNWLDKKIETAGLVQAYFGYLSGNGFVNGNGDLRDANDAGAAPQTYAQWTQAEKDRINSEVGAYVSYDASRPGGLIQDLVDNTSDSNLVALYFNLPETETVGTQSSRMAELADPRTAGTTRLAMAEHIQRGLVKPISDKVLAGGSLSEKFKLQTQLDQMTGKAPSATSASEGSTLPGFLSADGKMYLSAARVLLKLTKEGASENTVFMRMLEGWANGPDGKLHDIGLGGLKNLSKLNTEIYIGGGALNLLSNANRIWAATHNSTGQTDFSLLAQSIGSSLRGALDLTKGMELLREKGKAGLPFVERWFGATQENGALGKFLSSNFNLEVAPKPGGSGLLNQFYNGVNKVTGATTGQQLAFTAKDNGSLLTHYIEVGSLLYIDGTAIYKADTPEDEFKAYNNAIIDTMRKGVDLSPYLAKISQCEGEVLRLATKYQYPGLADALANGGKISAEMWRGMFKQYGGLATSNLENANLLDRGVIRYRIQQGQLTLNPGDPQPSKSDVQRWKAEYIEQRATERAVGEGLLQEGETLADLSPANRRAMEATAREDLKMIEFAGNGALPKGYVALYKRLFQTIAGIEVVGTVMDITAGKIVDGNDLAAFSEVGFDISKFPGDEIRKLASGNNTLYTTLGTTLHNAEQKVTGQTQTGTSAETIYNAAYTAGSVMQYLYDGGDTVTEGRLNTVSGFMEQHWGFDTHAAVTNPQPGLWTEAQVKSHLTEYAGAAYDANPSAFRGAVLEAERNWRARDSYTHNVSMTAAEEQAIISMSKQELINLAASRVNGEKSFRYAEDLGMGKTEAEMRVKHELAGLNTVMNDPNAERLRYPEGNPKYQPKWDPAGDAIKALNRQLTYNEEANFRADYMQAIQDGKTVPQALAAASMKFATPDAAETALYAVNAQRVNTGQAPLDASQSTDFKLAYTMLTKVEQMPVADASREAARIAQLPQNIRDAMKGMDYSHGLTLKQAEANAVASQAPAPQPPADHADAMLETANRYRHDLGLPSFDVARGADFKLAYNQLTKAEHLSTEQASQQAFLVAQLPQNIRDAMKGMDYSKGLTVMQAAGQALAAQNLTPADAAVMIANTERGLKGQPALDAAQAADLKLAFAQLTQNEQMPAFQAVREAGRIAELPQNVRDAMKRMDYTHGLTLQQAEAAAIASVSTPNPNPGTNTGGTTSQSRDPATDWTVSGSTGSASHPAPTDTITLKPPANSVTAGQPDRTLTLGPAISTLPAAQQVQQYQLTQLLDKNGQPITSDGRAAYKWTPVSKEELAANPNIRTVQSGAPTVPGTPGKIDPTSVLWVNLADAQQFQTSKGMFYINENGGIGVNLDRLQQASSNLMDQTLDMMSRIALGVLDFVIKPAGEGSDVPGGTTGTTDTGGSNIDTHTPTDPAEAAWQYWQGATPSAKDPASSEAAHQMFLQEFRTALSQGLGREVAFDTAVWNVAFKFRGEGEITIGGPYSKPVDTTGSAQPSSQVDITQEARQSLQNVIDNPSRYNLGKPLSPDQQSAFAAIYTASRAEGAKGDAATAMAISIISNPTALRNVTANSAEVLAGRVSVTDAASKPQGTALPTRTSVDAALVGTNNARLASGLGILDEKQSADFKALYNQSIKDTKDDAATRQLLTDLFRPESKDKLAYVLGRMGEATSGKPGVTIGSLASDYATSTANNKTQIAAIASRFGLEGTDKYSDEQAADFMLIYNWVTQKEKGSDQSAAETAHDLLLGKNAGILRTLKQPENIDRIVKGEKVQSVQVEIEADRLSLVTLSDELDAAIRFSQAAGDTSGALMYTGLKGLVDMAKANADAGKVDKAIGNAIKEACATMGKSWSQIMDMIGRKDLKAYGVVIEDMGKVVQQFVSGNALDQTGSAMKTAGDGLYAIGVQTNNIELQASGKMMSGFGDLIAGLGGKNSNTSTGAGGAAGFIGGIVAGIGILKGDKELTNAGNTILSASSVLGSSSSITNLISSGKWDQAFTQGISFSLNLSGALVGGNTGKLLSGLGGMANTAFAALKAIENAGGVANAAASGSLEALALTALLQGLTLAGVKIPPQFLEMASLAVQALTENATQAALDALKDNLATLVVEVAKEMGIELAKTAVTEALTNIGTVLTVVGVIYKVVQFGFKIAEIADRNDISDMMKASLATTELSHAVASAGVMAGNWVVLVVAAVINAAAAIMDMTENGVNQQNVGQLLAGDVGVMIAGSSDTVKLVLAAGDPTQFLVMLLPKPRVPNTWEATISPADESQHPNDQFALHRFPPDADGIIRHTGGGHDGWGNRDAFIRTTTPFGIVEFSMHELPSTYNADEPRYWDGVMATKPLLLQLRNVDDRVAAAINQADAENGQAGQTMAYYNANLVGNPIKYNQNLNSADFTGMADSRYQQIGDRLGASGTKAGTTYNAWADMLHSKCINGSGIDVVLANVIGSNPNLLKLSPEIIRRIGNTIAPGAVNSVALQLGSVLGQYMEARYNPYVQSQMPMDDNQAMDRTIQMLHLTEGYQWVATPTTSKPLPGTSTVGSTYGVPQAGKDLVTSLNQNGILGHPSQKITLMGMSSWNTNYYELRIGNEQHAYELRGNQFYQVSNRELVPGTRPSEWLKNHTLSNMPLTPVFMFGRYQTSGDMQWVDTNAAIPANVEKLARVMKDEDPSFEFLGATKGHPGWYEIFIPGRGQHAYSAQMLNGELTFMQETQITLERDNVMPAQLAS